MANGLAQGIQTGLAGLAAGIAQRRRSQAEMEMQAQSAKALNDYLKTGVINPALLSVPGATQAIFGQMRQPEQMSEYQRESLKQRQAEFQYEKDKDATEFQYEKDKDATKSTRVEPDKKVSDYVNDEGRTVVIWQKADGDTYEKIYGKVRPLASSASGPSKEKAAILKKIDAKTKEAYATGQALTNYNYITLTDPGIVDLEKNEFKSPKQREEYDKRRISYEDKLKALREELKSLNETIGGTFNPQPKAQESQYDIAPE